MAEYIEREAVRLAIFNTCWRNFQDVDIAYDMVDSINAVDVVEVVQGYHPGDVCIYGFGNENKSCALVEIVRVLSDERGVAEVKFLKVFVDDTGNGYFNYLLRSGNTMNASFKYLKNITPMTEVKCPCGLRDYMEEVDCEKTLCYDCCPLQKEDGDDHAHD